MEQKNYPKPNQPVIIPASVGTQNTSAKTTVGYQNGRGKAATSAGKNYSSPGTGAVPFKK